LGRRDTFPGRNAACPDPTVTSADSELPVAVDGEIEWLPTPLRYRIRPLALTVIRPAGVPLDARA
jgi:diacylglycerol kinase family enzyme